MRTPTMPVPLRYWCASNAKLTAMINKITVREIRACYGRQAINTPHLWTCRCCRLMWITLRVIHMLTGATTVYRLDGDISYFKSRFV